jgi:hypothetical protein
MWFFTPERLQGKLFCFVASTFKQGLLLKFRPGLPDFSCFNIPKWQDIYLHTKLPQNKPNGGKIGTPNGLKSTKMAIKYMYPNFPFKAYNNKPKLGILV